MANIVSAQSGLASDPTTWIGGVVPVDGDHVTIAAGHTVEIDGTYTWGNGVSHGTWNSTSSCMDVFGVLKASRATSSKLSPRGTVIIRSGGKIDYGTNADPIPANITAEIEGGLGFTTANHYVIMQQRDDSGNTPTLWSFISATTRSRWTKLSAPASAGDSVIYVEDANTNWEVGDTILLVSTEHTPTISRHEYATIDSVVGNAVTLTAPLEFAHRITGPVGCITSNIRLTKHANTTVHVAYQPQFPRPATAPSSGSHPEGYKLLFDGVEMNGVWGSSNTTSFFSFISTTGVAIYEVSVKRSSMIATANINAMNTGEYLFYNTYDKGIVIDDCVSVCRELGSQYSSSTAFVSNSLLVGRTFHAETTIDFDNCDVFTREGNSIFGHSTGVTVRNSRLFGIHTNLSGSAGDFYDCDIGDSLPLVPRYNQSRLITLGSFGANLVNISFIRCSFGSAWSQITPGLYSTQRADSLVQVLAEDNNPLNQKYIKPQGLIAKTVDFYKNSPSSFYMSTYTTDPLAHTTEVRVIANQVVEFFVNVRSFSLPVNSVYTITVLDRVGVVIDNISAPVSGMTSWIKNSIMIDNSGKPTQVYRLVVSLQTETPQVGLLAVSGFISSPFIDSHRHYGYRFNETTLGLTPNPLVVADEATAASYTGVSVSGGDLSFTTGIVTEWQQVYDYLNHWLVENINTPVFVTLAGGNLTISEDFTVVDPPELDGAFGFADSTIELSADSPLSYSGCTIIFTEPGTYSFGTLGGTTIFQNTSGGAVIAAAPTGAAYVIDGPNITVTEPILTASVTINGLPTGARVQLYDTSTGTELVNGIDATTWSEPYTVDRNIRLRAMYMDGTTAIQFIDQQIGTITSATPSITTLVAPIPDTVYQTNGVDGSLVTGVTIDDNALLVEVSTGTLSWAELYAYETYWLFTEEGIRDEQRFATAIDPANYIWHDFRLKNVTSPLIPITITGGYGRDSATGTSIALLDTTGGPIFMAPDIVVPYAAGAEATVGIVQAGLTAQGLTPTKVTEIAKESSVQTNIALTVSK